MRYIYGPLKSRRLGNSLGVNLTPFKTCSFDCIYCQLGPTTNKTLLRKNFLPLKEIVREIEIWLEVNKNERTTLDYITLSGSGEPTLNSRISELIENIKQITDIPVAVITNASLLMQKKVRTQLLSADLIVPSLDAVTQSAFKKIDKPLKEIKLKEIIEGLKALRREFKGKIWLEVMVVKGINDNLTHIKKLKKVVEEINPDKIQINSPVRATSKKDVFSAQKKKLLKIKEILGRKAEVV